ncbi:ribosomal protein S8 [Thermobaculum terrenum ATCC BAA-798]|uniref:Small ribosomal subunit protein uS8 n=1 Tax=Thermobaculum terrenum (strain ATCC BAA-798 / CCMEE 7001 / YNP1) TaxID=525904 RepID=D1CFE0_THET1|nr:30S ribosomal protein S8 [Thermobaculum terrenum]ACZ41646.1 ribosomal protein S8 [Thermobaculum terrenum ATCC BAA-798]
MGTTTDPIADMLTRLRNASQARHKVVALPSSKMKEAIARILKEEGYIEDYQVVPGKGNQPEIRITLRYDQDRQPVIRGIKRISKPGLRIYTKRSQIPRPLSGLGTAILSTPKGVMSGRQAYRQGVGGEIICYVW